ncbi:MAG: lysyl oxidase family protein [Phycisphaerae bacterium]|nr:lysyl oxidase family protein [Phycisphaerae bacterium]MDW8261687.1 lysyl oxidase family protein [Phycisphaerales bacterium]
MPAPRRNRSLRSRTLPSAAIRTVEPLEVRRLLHAGHDHAQGMEGGLPHISLAEYLQLSPRAQALFDPHQVEDTPEGPIDFDAILGVPLYPDGPPANENTGNLPDFFPTLQGGTSLDQTSQPGRTLVRFGTRVNNQGTGPASLISGRPGVDPIPSGAPITSWVNPDGSQNVLQAVYTFNGSSFSLAYYRAGGQFTYHPGHGHFHFDGYAFYKLRHRNPDGTPGAYVMRDGSEVVGTKTGFCLINTTSSFIMENGQSSTTLPGYGAPGQPTMSCGLMQGVRVGHADDYSSSLEGQWIDVTGVPNGQYFIEIQLDGENAVLESNETNNAKSFPFTLNANPPSGGIQPDVYDVGGNNNTLASATNMGVMGTFNQTGLTIHYGQDFDWFRFEASSSGNYTITTAAASGNLDLYLYDSTGTLLRSSTGTGSSESVSFPFEFGRVYYVKTEAYNSTTVSNYQITWNLKPTVTNAVGTSFANELGQTPATFLIARNGPTTTPLSVTFAVSGTAVRDVDYTLEADLLINPTTVNLGDLQSVAEIRIVPINDGVLEAPETVTLTITSNNAYVIGGSGAGTITINDVPPQVTATSFSYQTLPIVFNFDFTMNVSASLEPGDVELRNLDTDTILPVLDGVSYNPANNRATFQRAAALPDGNYRLTLIGSRVTHALGQPMLSNVAIPFHVFAGDANLDRTVDLADFSALAGHFGLSGTFSQGNFNYDALVDLADFAILASRFNETLPPPSSGGGGGGLRPAGASVASMGTPTMPPNPFGSTRIDRVAEEIELLGSSGVV